MNATFVRDGCPATISPGSLVDLGSVVATAIGQRPTVTATAISFDLPQAAPEELDADLFFAFPDGPDLKLRVFFEGPKAVMEAGEGEPRDTVSGSLGALLDFFSNRRSSQALFLEGDWQLADGSGSGARDLDDMRDYIRLLETLLPAPYELTPELRRRVRASADRIGTPFDVASRPDLGPDEFVATFVRTGTPVVLRGGFRDAGWWTFERLRQVFRAGYTHFSRYPNCSYSIHDCIARIESGDAGAFKAALPVTRELRAHYSLADYWPPETVFEKAQALLIAPADERMPASYRATAWHRDWADNLLTEMRGRKKVRIASPLDAERFALTTEPACHYNVAVDHSPVDPKAPLAWDDLTVRDVVLEPGDVLFLPCGWLHTVENITPTIAINSWRVRPPEMLAL